MEAIAKAIKCLNNKSNLRITINTPLMLGKKKSMEQMELRKITQVSSEMHNTVQLQCTRVLKTVKALETYLIKYYLEFDLLCSLLPCFHPKDFQSLIR